QIRPVFRELARHRHLSAVDRNAPFHFQLQQPRGHQAERPLLHTGNGNTPFSLTVHTIYFCTIVKSFIAGPSWYESNGLSKCIYYLSLTNYDLSIAIPCFFVKGPAHKNSICILCKSMVYSLLLMDSISLICGRSSAG